MAVSITIVAPIDPSPGGVARPGLRIRARGSVPHRALSAIAHVAAAACEQATLGLRVDCPPRGPGWIVMIDRGCCDGEVFVALELMHGDATELRQARRALVTAHEMLETFGIADADSSIRKTGAL